MITVKITKVIFDDVTQKSTGRLIKRARIVGKNIDDKDEYIVMFAETANHFQKQISSWCPDLESINEVNMFVTFTGNYKYGDQMKDRNGTPRFHANGEPVLFRNFRAATFKIENGPTAKYYAMVKEARSSQAEVNLAIASGDLERALELAAGFISRLADSEDSHEVAFDDLDADIVSGERSEEVSETASAPEQESRPQSEESVGVGSLEGQSADNESAGTTQDDGVLAEKAPGQDVNEEVPAEENADGGVSQGVSAVADETGSVDTPEESSQDAVFGEPNDIPAASVKEEPKSTMKLGSFNPVQSGKSSPQPSPAAKPSIGSPAHPAQGRPGVGFLKKASQQPSGSSVSPAAAPLSPPAQVSNAGDAEQERPAPQPSAPKPVSPAIKTGIGFPGLGKIGSPVGGASPFPKPR